MGKKILDSKALYVFLSIVIAIALWFYITGLDGNERTETIGNIPITFVGEDTLEARGLMIVGKRPTGSVRVKATPAVLSKLNNETVKLMVNVSQLEQAADYTLAYTPSLPTGITSDQVEFVSGGTGNVSFTVARYLSRQVEVRGVFTGTVAEGYLPGTADEIVLSPEKITVSGQSNLVNQVAYARVTIGGKDLTAPISGDFPFELIGVSGEVLEDLGVTCEQETVYASFPILATAEIMLEIKLVPGGGLSENLVSYTLSTGSITVAGSKTAVDAIRGEPHIITTVYLADIEDGEKVVCPIPLRDELINLSGIDEVTITFELSDLLQMRTFHVTEFDVINVPEGLVCTVITQQLAVDVRGNQLYVNALTDDSVSVVVDLADAGYGPGQYTVSATVYLDSAGNASQIGVMGTDHRVVILLSEDTGEPAQANEAEGAE